MPRPPARAQPRSALMGAHHLTRLPWSVVPNCRRAQTLDDASLGSYRLDAPASQFLSQ